MGGLLGLFMGKNVCFQNKTHHIFYIWFIIMKFSVGFSVFSIIEVIYYMSIRPYFNYLKDSDRRRRAFQRVFRRFRNCKVTGTMTVTHTTPMNDNVIFPHAH